jgi:uncharacterized protein
MPDGCVTAIVVGPVSSDPREMDLSSARHRRGCVQPWRNPGVRGISAVAVRHNDISNILSTAPSRFEPIYRRKPNREVGARPWCEGFYAVMKLRMSAWALLLDIDEINHGLLFADLLHCVDDQGRPLLGPTWKGPEGKAFMRKAYTDIPAVVEAIRQ